MLDKLKGSLAFQAEALQMRSKRQSVIASNISNVDTPGYKAVDVNFASALGDATGKKPSNAEGVPAMPKLKMVSTAPSSVVKTHASHISGKPVDNSDFARNLQYRRGDTGSVDGNSVNIERERSLFAENTVKYEASLKALNGRLKTLKAAMRD